MVVVDGQDADGTLWAVPELPPPLRASDAFPAPPAPRVPPPSVPPPPPPYIPTFEAPPQSTHGLRTAVIALYWSGAGASVLTAVAIVNRRAVWSGFMDGSQSFADLDEADALAAIAILLEGSLLLAAIIVVSIWSLRAVRNARSVSPAWRAGQPQLSPGLACGGWYIPFAGFIVPFVQLRRAARRRDQSTSAVSAWQGLVIVQGVANVIFLTLDDLESASTVEEVSGRLTAEVVVAFVVAAATVAIAIVATRAMRAVDGDGRPVSAPSPR